VAALADQLEVKRQEFAAAYHGVRSTLAAAHRKDARAREVAALESLLAALFAMPEMQAALAAAAPDDPFHPLLWQSNQMPTASEILSA
jgi:hypothetical protein